MDKGFRIKETKNCRKYTRHVYELGSAIDDSFVQTFSLFGKPEVTYFSEVVPGSHDMLKIRSYDFCFEIAGSLHGHDLIVTFEKRDEEVMQMVQQEIMSWSSAQ